MALRAQPAQLDRRDQPAIQALRAQPARLVRQVVAVVHRLFQLSRWSGRLRLLRFRTLPTDRLDAINLILLTLESLKFGQASRAPTTLTTLPCSTLSRLMPGDIWLSEMFRQATERRRIF